MRIMIVGAGRVGHFLSEKLSGEGKEVVLVDRDEAKLRRIERDLNIMTVQGSGASAKVLEEAGIDQTDLFIAVTDSDEVNLVACILSQQYSVETRIARVRNSDFYSSGAAHSNRALGIDLLISPDQAITEEIKKLCTRHDAFETAEFAGGQVVLLGYSLHEGNPALGRTLIDLRLKGVVVAIVRAGVTIIPRGNDVLNAEDKVYLVVRKEDIPQVEAAFDFSSSLPKLVFIVGGGAIGRMTARSLEDMGVAVRLLEEDPVVCKGLIEELDETVVLNCDGLEASNLVDEGIDRADVVVAVTGSDTTNILASLLAKHHGAARCITKISRPDFLPMLSKLGIDMALSPQLVAANMILRFVRGRGALVSTASLLGSDAEVAEIRVPPSPKFKGVPLSKLRFPRGTIVGAVVGSEGVVIARGDTVLDMDDRLIIFLTANAREALEDYFEN
ncbi:MAG: Trk system potassium transporter TrkA [Proteobacteria bacterium]|nr:Trk system potassium transporter TrkA [Pseudomonadota bacterium]MBU1687521.1 Trk system potassium transporter TrkA [Pseudomonadota bacterium]